MRRRLGTDIGKPALSRFRRSAECCNLGVRRLSIGETFDGFFRLGDGTTGVGGVGFRLSDPFFQARPAKTEPFHRDIRRILLAAGFAKSRFRLRLLAPRLVGGGTGLLRELLSLLDPSLSGRDLLRRLRQSDLDFSKPVHPDQPVRRGSALTHCDIAVPTAKPPVGSDDALADCKGDAAVILSLRPRPVRAAGQAPPAR
jgi:hypothetical protein